VTKVIRCRVQSDDGVRGGVSIHRYDIHDRGIMNVMEATTNEAGKTGLTA
jgi:hypothetical protein